MARRVLEHAAKRHSATADHRFPMIAAFLMGLLCGFVGSMPIAGPIAGLVVSRGLENRSRSGMATAIGSAFAESPYALMAYWGLSALLTSHRDLLPLSRLLGASILASLGVYFVVHRVHASGSRSTRKAKAGWGDALLGFTMTVANPTLIVTWTATVGILQSTGLVHMQASDAFAFAAGAWVGIVAWFAIMLLLIERFRAHVKPATLARTIQIFGGMLIALGLGLGIRAIVSMIHPR